MIPVYKEQQTIREQSPGKQMTFKEWTEEKVVPGSKNTAEGLDPSDHKEVKILRLSKTW